MRSPDLVDPMRGVLVSHGEQPWRETWKVSKESVCSSADGLAVFHVCLFFFHSGGEIKEAGGFYDWRALYATRLLCNP